MNDFLKKTWARRDQMVRELAVRYPRLLGPNQVKCYPMFGPGWYHLVDGFFRRCNELLDETCAERFRLEKCCEKHGRLKIQYYTALEGRECEGDGVYDAEDGSHFPCAEIRAIKFGVESRSNEICFYCAAPGKLRETSWMHVSCDPCESKLPTET